MGELEEQYRRRFAAEAEARRATWRVLVDAWFSRYLVGVEAVLDLGCGWGEFINHARALRRYALDLNPDARTHVDPQVQLFVQPASARWPLSDASLDLVFTSNFLEHLPDRSAVRATLREARRCLRRNGRIVCLGPNVRCAPGRYWDFFDHVVPLSDRSLVEVLELTGFAPEEVVARFLPWSMAGRPAPPAWMIHMYLRVRPVWHVLGRQFLVVARAV